MKTKLFVVLLLMTSPLMAGFGDGEFDYSELDHGTLLGLADDDHPQYVPYIGAITDLALGTHGLQFSNQYGDTAEFNLQTVQKFVLELSAGVSFEVPSITGINLIATSGLYSPLLTTITGDLTITAAGGDISFSNENLATTGDISGKDITASATVQAADLYSTDELVVDNDANIIGDVNIVGEITLGDVGGLGGALGSDAKLYPISGGCVLQVESPDGLAANLENPPIRFTYYDHTGTGGYIPAIDLGYGQHAAAAGLGVISRTLFVRDVDDTLDGLIFIPKAGTTGLTDTLAITFYTPGDKARIFTTPGKARPIEINGAGGVNILSSGSAATTIGDGGTTNYAQVSATGDVSFAGSAELIIPSSTTLPGTSNVGSLYLDTDAGANGTLYMYANGAWRAIVVLP